MQKNKNKRKCLKSSRKTRILSSKIHNFRCSDPKTMNVGLLERPFLPLKLS